MVSRARPLIAVVLLFALLTAAGAAPLAVAARGNSGNAHACQQGGWQWLTRGDGSTFRNTGDCVSYGAHGGEYSVTSTVEFRFVPYDSGRCYLTWVLIDGQPGDVVHVNTTLLQTTLDSEESFSATVSTAAPQAISEDVVSFEYVYDSSTAYVVGSGLPVAVHNAGSAQCSR